MNQEIKNARQMVKKKHALKCKSAMTGNFASPFLSDIKHIICGDQL